MLCRRDSNPRPPRNYQALYPLRYHTSRTGTPRPLFYYALTFQNAPHWFLRSPANCKRPCFFVPLPSASRTGAAQGFNVPVFFCSINSHFIVTSICRWNSYLPGACLLKNLSIRSSPNRMGLPDFEMRFSPASIFAWHSPFRSFVVRSAHTFGFSFCQKSCHASSGVSFFMLQM